MFQARCHRWRGGVSFSFRPARRKGKGMASISGDDSVERGARPGKSQSCEVGGGRTAFGMCLNWRVLGGLALVALVVLVAAPSLAVRALPLLLVAVCPL